MATNEKYVEVQKFNQSWITAMLCILVLAILFLTFMASARQVSVFAFIPIIIVTGVFILFKTMKLTLSIDQKKIEYRFQPFHLHNRMIVREDIQQASVVRYKPISDYGGWGLRYNFKRGKAFTTGGNYGLELKLKNGKSILIGTQQPEALKSFLIACPLS